MQYINEKLARQRNALPMYIQGPRLLVAISDPMNTVALDELKFYSGFQTEPILVEDDKLRQIIDIVFEKDHNEKTSLDIGKRKIDERVIGLPSQLDIV